MYNYIEYRINNHNIIDGCVHKKTIGGKGVKILYTFNNLTCSISTRPVYAHAIFISQNLSLFPYNLPKTFKTCYCPLSDNNISILKV